MNFFETFFVDLNNVGKKIKINNNNLIFLSKYAWIHKMTHLIHMMMMRGCWRRW
jgi:hypothetical protein